MAVVRGKLKIILTPRPTRDKKSRLSHSEPPVVSFSLPPLDARGWFDHENGYGRGSLSQLRKDVVVALTRPSASESQSETTQLHGALCVCAHLAFTIATNVMQSRSQSKPN